MRENSNMKKITVLAALLVLVFSACGCSRNAVQPENADTVAAYLADEPVMQCEVDYFKAKNRATVVNMFSEKYGVDDFSDFWERNFDGENPAAVLDGMSLNDAVDAKARLILMKENGVYEDVSFRALEKKKDEYNAEHSNRTNTVGLNTIPDEGFYTYYIQTGEMELKNILAQGKLKPTEEEIKGLMAEKPSISENAAVSELVAAKYESCVEQFINENRK